MYPAPYYEILVLLDRDLKKRKITEEEYEMTAERLKRAFTIVKRKNGRLSA